MAEALEGLISELETARVALEDWSLNDKPLSINCALPAFLGQAAQALRLLGEAEKALEEIADGKLPPDQHGHHLAHRKCVSIARAALDKIRKGMG